MKKLFTGLFLAAFAVAANAQTSLEGITKIADSAAANPAMDVANAALKAHGGEKLTKLKTLTLIGSVDITPSNVAQTIPATFVMIFAGDRYRFELNNPFQPIKQIYDGFQTYSNAPNGFTLPPVNQLGFPLIQRIGDRDYPVSSLPDGKDGKNGFRITSPEGYYTDFYTDKKTGLIKKYDSSYTFSGNKATTSAEIDKYREVDGLMVPERYAQRFDMGQLTIYAQFKAKEIIVNKDVADDIFIMK